METPQKRLLSASAAEDAGGTEDHRAAAPAQMMSAVPAEIERAVSVREVADELRDLSYKLVPPSRPGQTTPT